MSVDLGVTVLIHFGQTRARQSPPFDVYRAEAAIESEEITDHYL